MLGRRFPTNTSAQPGGFGWVHIVSFMLVR